MNAVDADIEIDEPGWHALPDVEAVVRAALDAAARGCGLALMPGVGVSVLLTGDRRMREINRDWRSQDKPTNVLSFAALPPERLRSRPHAVPFLGDIALAHETVVRETTSEDKAIADHLSHLVVHGFLHLVGFDHEKDADAERMEALETAILAGMGIRDPYGDSAPVRAAPGGKA